MKKLVLTLTAVYMFFAILTACADSSGVRTPTTEVQSSTTAATIAVTSADTSSAGYKDGVYEAKTDPDGEGYTTEAKITVKDGKITGVDWKITDSAGKVFDEKYEDVFDSDTYKEQCRNDLKGAKTYGSKLIETQDLKKVDAIAGATWTNMRFKAAAELALKSAGRP